MMKVDMSLPTSTMSRRVQSIFSRLWPFRAECWVLANSKPPPAHKPCTIWFRFLYFLISSEHLMRDAQSAGSLSLRYRVATLSKMRWRAGILMLWKKTSPKFRPMPLIWQITPFIMCSRRDHSATTRPSSAAQSGIIDAPICHRGRSSSSLDDFVILLPWRSWQSRG